MYDCLFYDCLHNHAKNKIPASQFFDSNIKNVVNKQKLLKIPHKLVFQHSSIKIKMSKMITYFTNKIQIFFHNYLHQNTNQTILSNKMFYFTFIK